jgi:phage portal protein BeeE
VYLLPVHKSVEAERTLGEIAKGSIEEELASLQQEIRSFLETPPERASTLLRRFDSFEALRNRAKLYREVLAIEVTDLDQQLNKLSSAVEELLNQKSAA